MLLVVNCQNGFLEKCQSGTLRNIVEIADLMDEDDVWFLTWKNPPTEALYKKVDWEQTSPDYEYALYPELANLHGRRHAMTAPNDWSKELYHIFDKNPEIFIIGANTSNWLVDIVTDLWSNYRIKPQMFLDSWFSVGPKGAQSDANLALIRRFGAGIFRDWEAFKPPLVKRREATLADKAAARAEILGTDAAEEAAPAASAPDAPAADAPPQG